MPRVKTWGKTVEIIGHEIQELTRANALVRSPESSWSGALAASLKSYAGLQEHHEEARRVAGRFYRNMKTYRGPR